MCEVDMLLLISLLFLLYCDPEFALEVETHEAFINLSF